ncbi:hypothetical protein KY330_04650 [Candidatus Woesearchaeota archaeon]|nr:hypothetical protein [Candidatus Woesearchaeota archaeon]
MGKKKKEKKVSAKKLKYAKFKKEKPGTLDIKMPDLDPEQMKQKREDEVKIEKFLKFRPRHAPRVILKRKLKSKRDRIR